MKNLLRLYCSVEQSLICYLLRHLLYRYFILNSTGNGVVIHIPQFFDELEALEAKGDYAFKLSSLLVPYLMKMKEPEILIKKQSCSKQ